MSDAALSAPLLIAALLTSVAGMGWLALAMPVHALQAWDRLPSTGALKGLRWLGVSSLLMALCLCLAVDHASMASLVWVMAMVLAAVLVAMTLALRPRWLRLLAPWAAPPR
ncbi:MAG: DUF3325 domain-containing protein [Rubrivivax sp.]|nr:MAG: DUF3325 domain-containing protein [Rubrivivax sp.]